MGKPTEAELLIALDEAKRLRESGKDEFFLGKVVLNHTHRLKLLEELYRVTASFLHGESAQQHSKLVKAVEAYRQYEDRPG